MKIKISSVKENALLKRKELIFFVEHPLEGTPQLSEVRKAVASIYEVNQDLVYVSKLRTLTGTHRARGEAEVYEGLEEALTLTPEHIRRRNLPDRGVGDGEA